MAPGTVTRANGIIRCRPTPLWKYAIRSAAYWNLERIFWWVFFSPPWGFFYAPVSALLP